MDAALAGLLGAAVGAAAGVVGGLVTAGAERRMAVLRWEQDRVDETWQEERRSLLELTSFMTECAQAQAWLTWSARERPVADVLEEAARYDARMRVLLPKLLSAQAAASGLSDSAYGRVAPLVDAIVDLDSKLGGAASRLARGDPAAVAELVGYHEDAFELTPEIVRSIRNELRGARPR